MARPVGSKNTRTERWEEFAEWFVMGAVPRLRVEMEKLEGKEFINTVKDLLEYFQPKLQRNEHTGKDGEKLHITMNLPDGKN